MLDLLDSRNPLFPHGLRDGYVFKDLRSQPVSAVMHYVSCNILKIFMIIH
jgi:hypothetical protein